MASIQDRRPAPGLNINLASNNPFRRAASPAAASQTHLSPITPTGDSTIQKRTSTNPFLDSFEAVAAPQQPPVSRSPTRPLPPAGQQTNRMPFSRRPVGGDASQPSAASADLLSGLSLNDPPAMDRSQNGFLPRSGTMPNDAPPRPMRTTEQPSRPRQEPRPRRPKEENPFGSPEGAENRRPRVRRNSESSIAEFKDDARRRQERERRHRERDGKPRDPKSKRPPKVSRQMDLIDKLDVTSIYGTGMFHHDGPFDACNPHRNRNGLRQTPMQAFPEGSANNAFGGGKVAKNMDYDKFHGREAEGWSDYNATLAAGASNKALWSRLKDQVKPDSSFDPKRADWVYGEETAGLGASTFLEGTPAPRTAVQKHESESTDGANGLQRKKSISQKIRMVSRPRKRTLENGGRAGSPVTSPEARYQAVHKDGRPMSPGSPDQAQSAGGRAKMIEMNPFFADQGPLSSFMPDKKNGTQVTAQSIDGLGEPARPRTATSPSRGLAKKLTNEPLDFEQGKIGGSSGGLLTRMKSLKGGKKTRPDRSGSDTNGNAA